MSKRKLVVSTGNSHKVYEIRKILADLDIEVLSKNDIGLEKFDVVEDGLTLEENSVKKARELAERTNFMVIADDSGLFVDSLNGEPGVYSSRYAGEDGNDKKNNINLLENLKDKKDRSAAFKTVIALITEDKTLYTVEGICPGSIGVEPNGENGFGYDPLFIPDGYDKSFAELGDEVKNKISHRARALENLKAILKSIMED
jgi:XTP/dITP diphosphohydrolase